VSTAAARPVVLLAEKLAPSAVALLGDGVEVRHVDGTDRPALLTAVAGADALLVRSATKVDAEVLAAAPRLKVVARAGVGLDNVDVPAATARGVMVVNAPTSNIVSAAEHAVALLLAAARNIPAADASLRAGRWARSALTGVEINGKTAGIVGLGKIGQLVAQRLAAFGVELIAHDPYVAPAAGRPAGHRAAVPGRAARPRRHHHRPPAQDRRDPRPDRQGPAGPHQARRAGRQRRPRRPGRRARAGRGRAQRARRRGRHRRLRHRATTSSPLFELPQIVVTPHLGASTVEAQDRAGTDVARSVQLALAGEFVPDAVNVQLSGKVGEQVRPWLGLVRKLGVMLHAVAGRCPPRSPWTWPGELAAEDVSVLQLAALRGLFANVVEDPVTFVNVPGLAAERGVSSS
jgi:D-3-phosphoglycerate dehydrogenase